MATALLKERNGVAKIDGQFIGYATLPTAAPSLPQVLSVDSQGQLFKQPAGGVIPPGLYLPLAGGTMDAAPAGVISAHTITDIITLEGTPAGSGFDTTIQVNTGNDLLIQTDPADGVLMTTGAFIVDASIQTQINSITTIQPAPGYTYPNNPEIGLKIINWNNPTGFQQVGCEIFNTSSLTGEAEGLIITNVKSGGGSDAIGIRVDDVGLVPLGTSQAKGIEVRTINANGIAHGVDIQGVNGPTRVYAVQAQNLTASTGNATGYEMTNLTGNQDSRGILIDQINAGTNAFGAELNNIVAGFGNSYGILSAGITAGASAYGVAVNSITANGGTATGIEAVGMISPAGDCFGMNASNNLAGTGRMIGVELNGNSSQAGTAIGVDVVLNDCQDVVGGQSSIGYNAEKITAQAGGSGNEAMAYRCQDVLADGTAYAANLINVVSNNGNANGVSLDSVSAPNGEARGVRLANVSGDGRAYGVSVDNIQANTSFAAGVFVGNVASATTASYGERITNIGNAAIGNAAIGIEVNSVQQDITNPASQTFGVDCGSIISANSTGSRVRDVIAENRAKGFSAVNIDNNGAGGGFSIGYEATQIVSTAGNATGVRVVSVNGAGQSVGVLVNNAASTNPAVGSYGGLFQRGGKAVGAAGQLLRLFDGNLGLAVQQVADPAGPNNVFGDAGNFVLVDAVVGAGVPITLNLPAGGAWEVGQWFLFCKQGLAGPNIVDGGANNFNGVGGPFAFAGPVGGMCIIFWVGGAIGWAAHAF
jgi:hypothetical protein